MNGSKRCKRCGIEKPVSEFYIEKYRLDGSPLYKTICRECVRAKSAEWFANNPEKRRRTAIRYYYKIRMEAIFYYSDGSMSCACCGDSHVEFLTIHHVENNGAEHRREIGHSAIFQWLKYNDYPPGYQVLCLNCNFAKGHHGACPHELEQEGRYESPAIQTYRQRQQFHTTRTHLITFQDETHSLTEWAKKLGISERVLSTRINNHKWTIERALTQPARPTRRIRMITYDGRTQSLKDWAKETGISHDAIGMRLNRYGWSVEDALTKPARIRVKAQPMT